VKQSRHTLVSRIFAIRQYLLEHVPYKAIFLVTGVLATIWFLLRVIPKPSRAGYPCMQAVAPVMSGFVLYIISFTGSFFAFKKARAMIKTRSYSTAIVFLFVGLVMGATFFVTGSLKSDAKANLIVVSAPPDGANNPMGTPQGIFPGRVIWAWNPKAVKSSLQNVPGDAFWDYKNNDTLVIRGMVEQSILKLTGTSQFKDAWDSIFYNHNRNKHNISRGYQNGEKIYIKINQGTARWVLNNEEKANGYAWQTSGTIEPDWRKDHFAASETGPFVVLNILRQLVYEAGIPQENIAIGDPMSNTFKHNYDVWYKEFPNVKYTDKFSTNHKRTKINIVSQPAMNYSDQGAIMKNAVKESYFDLMQNADYLINVACLKPHLRAGVTLCAKNHFGSISKNGADHLHPSLIYPEEIGKPSITNQGYNKYRVAVDIMGHKNLGRNTILFVLEGLLGGGPSEIKKPVRWNSAPFNGDWSNSVFMSLDQVALESVAYDFLREEFNGVNQPQDYPNWLGVDDYLHQAAHKDNWPAGITYNPDGTGALPSLGVHEHWNNAIEKKYSRNLGTGNGIELIQTDGTSGAVSVPQLRQNNPLTINTYPNPFRDQMTIALTLNEPGLVSIQIVDLQGRSVAKIENRTFTNGNHDISWNATDHNLSPGFYMVQIRLTSGNQNYIQNQKVQLLK
jgi:hypothetical protein